MRKTQLLTCSVNWSPTNLFLEQEDPQQWNNQILWKDHASRDIEEMVRDGPIEK